MRNNGTHRALGFASLGDALETACNRQAPSSATKRQEDERSAFIIAIENDGLPKEPTFFRPSSGNNGHAMPLTWADLVREVCAEVAGFRGPAIPEPRKVELVNGEHKEFRRELVARGIIVPRR